MLAYSMSITSENKKAIMAEYVNKMLAIAEEELNKVGKQYKGCLLYTSPSPRDRG